MSIGHRDYSKKVIVLRIIIQEDVQYSELIEVDKEGAQVLAILNGIFPGDLFDIIKDKLIVLLNNYTNYSEGRGKVYDCSISKDFVEIKTSTSGRFRVDYKVHYFFGCEDVRSEADQHMKIDFKLDIEKGIVELVGEFWPEREPGY